MELIKVFVTVSTDVTAWLVPSAKYMIRFAGSKEARSKAPAAVVHPGIGIYRTVVRLALGVGVWAANDAARHRQVTANVAERRQRFAFTESSHRRASRSIFGFRGFVVV